MPCEEKQGTVGEWQFKDLRIRIELSNARKKSKDHVRGTQSPSRTSPLSLAFADTSFFIPNGRMNHLK